MVSIPAEVSDGASVCAALAIFNFVDDLHGADLGCATDGSCRKCGAEHVVCAVFVIKITMHVGHDVHHVAVALDDHEIIYGHAAVFGNSAYIVACKID